MISDHLRRWSRRIVEPIARALLRLGLTPNSLTLLGLGLVTIPAVLLALGRLQLAGVLILIFSAFDAFDGALARLSGRVTRFGAFLDSTLDRVSEGLLFLGLLIYFTQSGDPLSVYATYIALLGSLLVSYTRARAEGLGLRSPSGWFTRVERILLLSLGLIVGWVRPLLWILAVLTNITAVQRILQVYRMTRGDTDS